MAQSLITDEIQAWIGREATPWTIDVTTLDVKRFAVASDDPNPLYYDEDAAKQSRYGGLIAPPLCLHRASHGSGSGERDASRRYAV